MQLDKPVDRGNRRIGFVEFEISIGDVDLRLGGVIAERKTRFEGFVIFDRGQIVAFAELGTRLLHKTARRPVGGNIDLFFRAAGGQANAAKIRIKKRMGKATLLRSDTC